MTDAGGHIVDERRVMARVTRRFIPLAFICYVVAYLDRVNVGFVAGELQRDLGLSATAYGVAAGLFFLGYCVFEVPSNMVLERVGARRWIARIMITWGLVAMATTFVHDATTFMAARVLLGVAEAGFFPGMVLFFTYWFPASERARTGALFMTASPVAVIVGAPLSTWVLRMHGFGGLRGWQWLFLIEGLPAVVLGLVVLAVLTDRPEDARWLEPHERACGCRSCSPT
jgi:ACS family tartrate transporter-like MFS transporter